MELGGIDVKTVIDNFALFCDFLSKPENHVLEPSRQYVEKAVPSRTVSDMTNEMAQELAGLARYTAYARLIEEKDGRQRIIKEKIATIALPNISEEVRVEEDKRRKVIEDNSRQYLRMRDVIEEEIRRRQDRWTMGGAIDQPPPRRREDRSDEGRRGGPPPRSSRTPPE